ncbi:MAG TPA: sugar phosphate nucleotidyltransferase [Candidatus Dormibacteraeota bacterium]|nr:sugar phosphate nucleotidyltransferase [Candidatus Dormibacteraeota bacterium]
MARHVVILAGGSGTRLWPRSRQKSPKHLLALHGGLSLLQSTFERVRRLTDNVYVVTERSQVDGIREQLPDLPDERFIIEPARRGTASALGLAALAIAERDSDATMLSVHADHYLGNDEGAYLQTLEVEARCAEQKRSLVTVGLRPPYASTAFGYIQIGPPIDGDQTPAVYRVVRFVEKPDLKTAEGFLASGSYLWNLGLFSWPVEVLFSEMAQHAPELYAGLDRVKRSRRTGQQDEADVAYEALPTQAIDYAVLERTLNLLVVGATFEWHDIGSWADLHDILQQDEAGNFVEGDSVLIDTKNCMIHSPKKLVAAVGLEDMVVIETEDAILICPKARSQDVKLIVDRLKQMGKTEYL